MSRIANLTRIRPSTPVQLLAGLAATAALLLAPSPAHAVATLVAPAGGSKVANDTPTMSWTMADGEGGARLLLEARYFPNDKPSFEQVENPAIPDGTTSYTPKPLFAGGYRWSVATVAGGGVVTTPTSEFQVPEHLTLGRPKLVLLAKGKQVGMSVVASGNGEFLDASFKVKVNGRTWYTERGTFTLKRAGIDIPGSMGFVSEHKPAAKLAKGSRVVATLTIQGEYTSAHTLRKTYVVR
jgi:hypothetical protein